MVKFTGQYVRKRLYLQNTKQDDHQNDDGNDYDDPNDDDAHFHYGQDGTRAMED